MNKNLSINGIITPLITPLNNDFSLDITSLQKILDHIIDGGVKGIFVLGTTGEFSSFSIDFRRQIIREVCRIVDARVPVLIGVSSCSFTETEELIQEAKKVKADAVVASPPFYFWMSQNELTEYYLQIANKSSIPVYLYNIPSLTKTRIEPNTAKILSNHANIIGLKDSSGDMNYFEELGRLFENTNFQLFVGPEEHLQEALQLGANGGVNGGSNIFPEWYVKLFEAFQVNDFGTVRELQNKIHKLSEKVYHLSDSPTGYLQGLKAAMTHQNFCQNILAPPMAALPNEFKAGLEERLKEFV